MEAKKSDEEKGTYMDMCSMTKVALQSSEEKEATLLFCLVFFFFFGGGGVGSKNEPYLISCTKF